MIRLESGTIKVKGVTVVKRELGRWEERNNDDKEERLEFGTREGEKIRILSSWVGNERGC